MKLSTTPSKEPSASKKPNMPEEMSRGEFLGSMAVLIAAAAAIGYEVSRLLKDEPPADKQKSQPAKPPSQPAPPKPSQNPEPAPPVNPEPDPQVDPNRPEFLDEAEIGLTGLTLMMANNDQFDRYIFNAVTGNRTHAQTSQLQKGYEMKFLDGRTFVMPYHAFLFRAFDKDSNVNLPSRLGKASPDTGLANFFRQYTVYRADNPKDIEAIKTILITSYELSFGVKLDPEHIQIESDEKGRITTIKYTSSLIVSTTIATKTIKDEHDPERRNILATEKKRWDLIGKDGKLHFPQSAMATQGIALPHSALPKYPNVKYAKTFESQGRTIKINMNISIDAVLEEQEKFKEQERPKTFQINPGKITDNFGYYILEKDTLVEKLAGQITEGFETKREKIQAILDFAHSYNYVPDAYGEAPRSPRITLLSQGGDCEDSTILVVALARAVGIECIFAIFNEHAAPLCDIDEEGTALKWGGKNYEWCETTGGNSGVTITTKFKDPYTDRIIREEKEERGWRIGENDPKIGPIKFVSRVNDKELTRIK